jgi:hypothetical protein
LVSAIACADLSVRVWFQGLRYAGGIKLSPKGTRFANAYRILVVWVGVRSRLLGLMRYALAYSFGEASYDEVVPEG